MKLCKEQSFAFDHVQDHQIAFLKQASGGLYYKIMDTVAFSGYTNPKPFDCFWIKDGRGYLVVMFYRPHEYKKVFKLPIDEFVTLRDNHPRKSIRLNELEAKYTPIEL